MKFLVCSGWQSYAYIFRLTKQQANRSSVTFVYFHLLTRETCMCIFFQRPIYLLSCKHILRLETSAEVLEFDFCLLPRRLKTVACNDSYLFNPSGMGTSSGQVASTTMTLKFPNLRENPHFPSGDIDIKLFLCISVQRRTDNSRKHAWTICIHVELKLL
jgi:hypothetical protein